MSSNRTILLLHIDHRTIVVDCTNYACKLIIILTSQNARQSTIDNCCLVQPGDAITTSDVTTRQLTNRPGDTRLNIPEVGPGSHFSSEPSAKRSRAIACMLVAGLQGSCSGKVHAAERAIHDMFEHQNSEQSRTSVKVALFGSESLFVCAVWLFPEISA